MFSETAMRKWICLGVIGGLLEFGIVYQVAFYEPSPSPSRRTHAAAETARPNTSRARREAAKSVRRTNQTVAREAQTAAESPSNAPLPRRSAVRLPPPPAGGQPSAKAHAQTPRQPEAAQPDSLTSLLAAASSIASRAAVYPVAAPQAVAAPIPPSVTDLPQQPGSPLPQIDLGLMLPVPNPPAEPQPPPKAMDPSSLPVEEMIRHVFGPDGDKAVRVARCESTLRPHAKKGQFIGLFQMGANERADYGHGPDALAQVRAAYELFRDRGWQPWTCA